MNQVPCTPDTESDEYETPLFSPLKPADLSGCTFLTTPTEDGQCFHTCVMQCIVQINDTTDKVSTKFLLHKSNDELDEIMSTMNSQKFLKNNISKNSKMISVGNSNI